MIKNVQDLEWNTYRNERNLRNGEEQGLVWSELSKSGKDDNDSPIYRLPKGERVHRSARTSDRLACPIEHPVRSAGLFDQDFLFDKPPSSSVLR
ncbi:hypothetical protein Hanom_Chr13g01207641 [Helianthus anomalus]